MNENCITGTVDRKRKYCHHLFPLINCTSLLRPCFLSQREIDRGPFSDFSLRPDSSIVAANNSFDDGEADSSSFELLFGMEPLEGSKHPFGIGRIKPGAVVLDKINRSSRPFP